jgi:predicted metal-dependent phosphotriesterase family hydrolase
MIYDKINNVMEKPYLLIHEHVYGRIGATDLPIVEDALVEHLKVLSTAGLTRIVDCTAYHSPLPLRRISSRSGVEISSCLGFYLERKVPPKLRAASTEQLVRHLVLKRNRLAKAGMGPSIFKVALSSPQPSPLEKRLLDAVGLASKEIHLPIMVHAVYGGLVGFRRLVAAGADPERIIISHPEMGLKGARAVPYDILERDCEEIIGDGGSLCFTDLSSAKSTFQRSAMSLLLSMSSINLKKVLVSGDVGWRFRRRTGLVFTHDRGFGYGRSYHDVAPTLRRAGMSSDEIRSIFYSNPSQMLG